MIRREFLLRMGAFAFLAAAGMLRAPLVDADKGDPFILDGQPADTVAIVCPLSGTVRCVVDVVHYDARTGTLTVRAQSVDVRVDDYIVVGV